MNKQRLSEKLEELKKRIKTRENTYENKSESWRKSDNGKIFSSATDKLSDKAIDFESTIEGLEELIRELNVISED
jgi:hypothetical protein